MAANRKREQFGVFEQVMPDGFVGRVGVPLLHISDGDEHPDETGGHEYRLAFSQVDFVFQGDQGVGPHKDQYPEIPVNRPGKVNDTGAVMSAGGKRQ